MSQLKLAACKLRYALTSCGGSISRTSAQPIVRLLKIAWHTLPDGLRKRSARLVQPVLAAFVARAPRLTVPIAGPLRVIGFLSAASGLGEGARAQLRLFKALGSNPQQIDATMAVIPDRAVLLEQDASPHSAGAGGLAIIHINPPELLKALLDTKLAADAYRIGFWAWELEQAPDSWMSAERYVNEIWAPSEFCAQALRRTFTLPVHVMPHLPAMTRAPKKTLGRSVSTFTVLFTYDVLSSHVRKNPEACIRAFKLALEGEPNVRLILKISNAAAYPVALERLQAAAGGDQRIKLLTESLSEERMLDLYDAADVVLSLHRSEGFGLLLANAMLRGKCVIATDWSGNRDFMNSENSLPVPYRLIAIDDPQNMYSEARWAEPDVEAAAMLLRSVYLNEGLRNRVGDAAEKSSQKFFGAALERRYQARLRALGFAL